jgi:hypothetical protein
MHDISLSRIVIPRDVLCQKQNNNALEIIMGITFLYFSLLNGTYRLTIIEIHTLAVLKDHSDGL